MAGLRLDGAGQARMSTLEDAVALQQRLHGLVEQYALSVKRNQPAMHVMMNLKRQMPALAGLLKGQFGMISDLVTQVSMQSTRGSSELVRVRQLREGMAAIKVQLEIAIAQVIAKHEIKDDKTALNAEGD
jgi:hypothetical protein